MQTKYGAGGQANPISGRELQRRARRRLPLCATLFLLGGLRITASADVLGGSAVLIVRGSQAAEARLTIHSPSVPIHALNGEIAYDPAIFLAPAVQADVGGAGFLAEGHLVEPGLFRFVAYDDASPVPAAMNLSLPVLRFSFALANDDAPPQLSQIQFTLGEAATLDPLAGAISIEAGGPEGAPGPMNVEFQAFFAHVNPSSGAGDWALYE